MIKKLIARLVEAVRPRVSLKTTYLINGKKVSEEEWYINGGLEIEEELEEIRKTMERLFK